MNKLLVIYASALLAGLPITEKKESVEPEEQPRVEFGSGLANSMAVVSTVNVKVEAVYDLHSNSKIEDFSTKVTDVTSINALLLKDTEWETNKKPLQQMELNEIEFIENSPEIELGFDTQSFLPSDFDPYSAPTDIHAIDFIENDEIDLGFDTKPYLPEGFDPFESYFNIHSIAILEFEEEVEFNTADYLPEAFDPYLIQQFHIHSIDFMEEEDEIELGFDTRPYLPEGFDPYQRSN